MASRRWSEKKAPRHRPAFRPTECPHTQVYAETRAAGSDKIYAICRGCEAYVVKRGKNGKYALSDAGDGPSDPPR